MVHILKNEDVEYCTPVVDKMPTVYCPVVYNVKEDGFYMVYTE